MGARTSGREAALQMLFGIEMADTEVETAVRDYWRFFDGDPEGRAYADELIRDLVPRLDDVDQLIRKASTNWRLERMSRVDRNLLRVATWELQVKQNVPRAVILDEAVDLAKRYGTEDSGAFINGVLDRIADDLGRVDTDRPPRKGASSD